MNRLRRMSRLSELVELFGSSGEIKLYGAGYYLNIFLQWLKSQNEDLIQRISCIIVSDIKGHPARIKNISVLTWQDACIKEGDRILLTLGHRYTNEIYSLLKNTGADIIEIDFNMFQEIQYEEVRKSIQPFIDRFPSGCLDLNMPVHSGKTIAWTSWWQGEKSEPDIVKACIESQKRNLPRGVEQVVITEKNYKKYILLPDYVIRKLKRGDISLTTLSDMLRASLLYRYGGFWMDATLFVLRPLDSNILDYQFYTRNLPETQYCADAMWSGWFMYAKPGNILFRFLSEGLFYYFSTHDALKEYFMIDYIIAIACNIFPEVSAQMQAVPYNNEYALEMVRHLAEPFEQCKYEEYAQSTYIQKLTYKLDRRCADTDKYTFYDHLINA